MKAFNYKFHFVDGRSIILGSKEDIDLYEININEGIVFDDIYIINLQNVTYVEKEVVMNE